MAGAENRAFLIVMDSVGCGGAPDAAAFGDEGANTLGHIALACAEGREDLGRSGPLQMPNLDALGLGAAIRLSTGLEAPGLTAAPSGRWGAASTIVIRSMWGQAKPSANATSWLTAAARHAP